jgi:hypothetical protein
MPPPLSAHTGAHYSSGPNTSSSSSRCRALGLLCRRPVVVLLLAAAASAWWTLLVGVRQAEDVNELATALSGHTYHAHKLCSSSSSSSSSSNGDACSELHDPQLEDQLVMLPRGGVRLLSQDERIARLQQLLRSATDHCWPLPLARRLVHVLLQGAVPLPDAALEDISSSSTTASKQLQEQQPAPDITARDSGHAAGWRFATAAVQLLQLRANKLLVPCALDPSLPLQGAARHLWAAVWPSQPSPALANAVAQLLSAAAVLPPSGRSVQLTVHVPAGASADSLLWLDLLQLLAVPLGLPVHLAAAAAGGSAAPDGSAAAATHGAGNAALAPFFVAGGRRAANSSSADSGAGCGAGSAAAAAPDAACFSPEHVVFLEPRLFFCASDVVRLMQYRQQHMVCGLQLDEFKPAQLRLRRRHSSSRRLQHKRARRLHQLQPAAAGQAGSTQRTLAAAVAAGSASGMAGGGAASGTTMYDDAEVPREFELQSLRAAYDAAREITGDMLSAHAPYWSHNASLALVREGLPVPMYCCWGGLAKVVAAPFAAGLRLRRGLPGECAAADAANLLCDDLWRSGRGRILLDPGVRTSSQLRTKVLLEHPRFPLFYYAGNMGAASWADVQQVLPLAPFSGDGGDLAAAVAAPADDGGGGDKDDSGDPTAAALLPDGVAGASWAPGEAQVCCAGQADAGPAHFIHPTDCKHVRALAGANHTAAFLEQCASGGCP